MIRLRLALAGAVLLAALGCTKSLGPPSPQFRQARDRYLALLQKDGPGDVFTDPDLPAVRALLDGVPADSVDVDAAKSLRKTIDDGMAEAAKAEAARKAALATAPSNATAPVLTLPQPAKDALPTEAAAPAAVAPTGGPTEGMTAAEFAQKFGACFVKNSVFTDDKGGQGDAFALDPSCAKKYPSYANQLVLVSGEKVARVVPTSAVVSRGSFTLGSGQAVQPPPPPAPVAPPAAAPAAPPVPPGRADDKITGADDKVQAPSNQNSDLDARSKLPGAP